MRFQFPKAGTPKVGRFLVLHKKKNEKIFGFVELEYQLIK